jgi:hypothetical protein
MNSKGLLPPRNLAYIGPQKHWDPVVMILELRQYDHTSAAEDSMYASDYISGTSCFAGRFIDEERHPYSPACEK